MAKVTLIITGESVSEVIDAATGIEKAIMRKMVEDARAFANDAHAFANRADTSARDAKMARELQQMEMKVNPKPEGESA